MLTNDNIWSCQKFTFRTCQNLLFIVKYCHLSLDHRTLGNSYNYTIFHTFPQKRDHRTLGNSLQYFTLFHKKGITGHWTIKHEPVRETLINFRITTFYSDIVLKIQGIG
jgi:hypothetical protein